MTHTHYNYDSTTWSIFTLGLMYSCIFNHIVIYTYINLIMIQQLEGEFPQKDMSVKL